MKAQFEKITVSGDASWKLLHRLLPAGIPFEWHYHPEYELTLTLNSRGQRFVGDCIEYYTDGDLVLLGPNLPHTWESRELIDTARAHEVIVMWFSRGWISSLSRTVPELSAVEKLLSEAGRGIAFSHNTSESIRDLATSLPTLDVMDRLPVLLTILTRITREPAPHILASQSAHSLAVDVKTNQQDQDRIERVLDFMHRHYCRGLSVEALAKIAHLSVSGLSRLFRRATGTTISGYLIQLRIGRACAMLIEDRFSIAYIAAEIGFANLANFNRQFQKAKGMMPSEFRRIYRKKAKGS